MIMKKLDKLKIALDLIKEHNLTAYEIGKHTKISTFAVQKIINGDTKNPNETTVDVILDFIETAIIGTDIKVIKAEEEVENYEKSKGIDFSAEYKKCLENSIDQLKYIDYLKTLLRKNDIDFRE